MLLGKNKERKKNLQPWPISQHTNAAGYVKLKVNSKLAFFSSRKKMTKIGQCHKATR
jgi:hypothetical protein